MFSQVVTFPMSQAVKSGELEIFLALPYSPVGTKMAADASVCTPFYVYETDVGYFLDKDLQIPYEGDLYRLDGTYLLFTDSDLTHQCIVHQFVPQTVELEQSTSLPQHESWTRPETLMLIAQTRSFLENTDLPASIAELNERIKLSRGNQKKLFNKIAGELTENFSVNFSIKQVLHKCQSLVDGLKNAIDNNNGTGKGRSKFAYFREMNELLGDHPDINFPVTATAAKVTVHKTTNISCEETLSDEESSSTTAEPDIKLMEKMKNQSAQGNQMHNTTNISCEETFSDEESSSTTAESDMKLMKKMKNLRAQGNQNVPTGSAVITRPKGSECPPLPKRPRRNRHRENDDTFMKYLSKADEKLAEREKAFLDELKSFHNSFVTVMDKLLDKL